VTNTAFGKRVYSHTFRSTTFDDPALPDLRETYFGESCLKTGAPYVVHVESHGSAHSAIKQGRKTSDVREFTGSDFLFALPGIRKETDRYGFRIHLDY
jgi:hypothetical protein